MFIPLIIKIDNCFIKLILKLILQNQFLFKEALRYYVKYRIKKPLRIFIAYFCYKLTHLNFI